MKHLANLRSSIDQPLCLFSSQGLLNMYSTVYSCDEVHVVGVGSTSILIKFDHLTGKHNTFYHPL